jgi:uncharacterized membrane protein HdeD (DUF308 family)
LHRHGLAASGGGWGGYWSILTRLASTVLGGMIIAQWPASGLWAIGLFLTIELLFNG